MFSRFDTALTRSIVYFGDLNIHSYLALGSSPLAGQNERKKKKKKNHAKRQKKNLVLQMFVYYSAFILIIVLA